jgi:hypothetical protein
VQAGIGVATAEKPAEAGTRKRASATLGEAGQLPEYGLPEAEGIAPFRGAGVTVTGWRGAEARRLPAGEVERGIARRELLVRRLEAARVTGVEGQAEAERAGDDERLSVVGGRPPHRRPLSHAPADERRERGERPMAMRPAAAYYLVPSLNSEGESEGTAGRDELAVAAVLLRGGVERRQRDGLRGVRRGAFEAEEDLRLELVR